MPTKPTPPGNEFDQRKDKPRRRDYRKVEDRSKQELPDRTKRPKRPSTGRKSIYTETDASSSRKAAKKKGPDMTGPATVAGIAGLRRAAASGALDRMRNSGIREMRIRETDAYRRLAAREYGKNVAKMEAGRRQTLADGINRSTPMQILTGREEGKRLRKWSSGSFPQGEPSGKRPIRFTSPGSLKTALEAGKEARRGGRPKTAGPATRTKSGKSSGGGTGRGGTRGGGVKGGGGAFLPQQRGFGEQ